MAMTPIGQTGLLYSIKKGVIPMNKYETLKADMTKALKDGDKERRLTLADIVATLTRLPLLVIPDWKSLIHLLMKC